MANMNSPSIGWIGVGAMGLPICINLMRAGHSVAVYDIRADRVELAKSQGAIAAASATELAKSCRLVFCMVFDDAALESVVSEILESLQAGDLVVDLSTVSPAASARVARLFASCDVHYLRAPVSGSVSVAETGKLSIFISGDEKDFVRSQPVLAAFTSTQRYVGEGEAARIVKLAINMLVVNLTALLGEAIAFSECGGVPRELIVDCINESIVGSRHSQSRAQGLKTRQYTDAGPVRLGAKDMDLALDMAREHSLGLPITALIRQYVTELTSGGHGNVEITKLAEFPRVAKG